MKRYTFQGPQVKLQRILNRNRPTKAEKLLWRYLRRKQLLGCRFQRQYSVDNYILDFYCPKARLGIELDGSQHAELQFIEQDRIRTINIESYNIKVVRFWNSEVTNNIQDVLTTIGYYLNRNH